MTLADWLIKALGGYTYREHRRKVKSERELMKYCAQEAAYCYAEEETARERYFITQKLEDIEAVLEDQTTDRGRIILGEDSEQRIRVGLAEIDENIEDLHETMQESKDRQRERLDEWGEDDGE